MRKKQRRRLLPAPLHLSFPIYVIIANICKLLFTRKVNFVRLHDDLFFRDGQKRARLCRVKVIAFLFRLSVIRHGYADKNEESRVYKCACGCPEKPCCGKGGKSHSPPHKNLSEVVRMACILPESKTDKGGRTGTA